MPKNDLTRAVPLATFCSNASTRHCSLSPSVTSQIRLGRLGKPNPVRLPRKPMKPQSNTSNDARSFRQDAIHLVVMAGILMAFVAFIASKFFPSRPDVASIYGENRKASFKVLQELSGRPQAPEHFYGTWRRPLKVANLDVRRVRLHGDQGSVRIQAWYQCQSPSGECDAGEHAANVEREPAGGIARIALDAAIPEGRIRLTIAPGRTASAPILLLTEAEGGDYLPSRVLSNAQVPIERERNGVPPGEFIGEWFWPKGGQPGNFTRMVIREAGAGALTVRAWTACDSAGMCDLGETPLAKEQIEGGLVVALTVRYNPDARTQIEGRLYPPQTAGMEVRTVVSQMQSHERAPADRQGRGGFNRASWSHFPAQHLVTRQPSSR